MVALVYLWLAGNEGMEKKIFRCDYTLIPIRLTSGKLEVYPLLGGRVQVFAM